MKKLSRICTLLMVLALVFSLSANVFATGTVTYDGDANEFIFEPGSKYSPTDLFPGLKNVMPGDVLEDQVVIFNDTSNKVKVNVYMRALGAQEDTPGQENMNGQEDLVSSAEFLSQMTLTVTKQDDTKLFEAPANETAQLTDWVYLGTLYSGGEITLNLKLEVPIEMGNEFQHQIGYLDWEFKVEEVPIKTPGVQTGDESNLLFFGGLLLISLLAMVALLLTWRRKRNH